MEAWLLSKVAEWVETIENLGRFAIRYPQTAYAGLAMSLHSEWKYLVWIIPGVGEYMGPNEEVLANKILPKLLGLQSISGSLGNLLALGATRRVSGYWTQRRQQTKATRRCRRATNA